MIHNIELNYQLLGLDCCVNKYFVGSYELFMMLEIVSPLWASGAIIFIVILNGMAFVLACRRIQQNSRMQSHYGNYILTPKLPCFPMIRLRKPR